MKISQQNLWFVIILLFVLLFSGGLLIIVILEVEDYIRQSNFQGTEDETLIYSETFSEKDKLDFCGALRLYSMEKLA